MGHAGMAAAAVRYLRAAPADRGRGTTNAPPVVDALPRPELRCVGEHERAPVDQAEFRRVLGNFATGVTVITAPGVQRAAEALPESGTPAEPVAPAESGIPAVPPPAAGFACQSFSALSLDPPLVVFMVGRTSTTWPRIARAGVFCVNVLGAEQGELCRRFAVSGADKFAGVAHTPAPATGSPRLTGAPAWIDCTIHAVHPGGDHLIVVGRVEALGTDTEATPLLFHRGRFGAFTLD
ncbi:flavin reductase family protein [Streptomyces sp. SP18BB07]|uniref:flavin reductase family protein n=1 Tax=Streptomyces sp. SP18BB07 TaxID=3002522 RepID=UPI002E77F55B|nr:flavin reductase family protein [Streptomyces sp. SP18BB07]MEE1761758.1 flavin reductase family protein [Streptomyces sp. SP18BB07]